MIRRDFLERQFEEFAKYLAHIMGLRKEMNFQQADKQLNELLRMVAGSDGGWDPEEPMDAFFQHLESGERLGPDHWILLGNILLEQFRNTLDLHPEDEKKLGMLGKKALHLLLVGLLEDSAIFRMAEINSVNYLVSMGIEPEERTEPLLKSFEMQFM